MKIFTKSIMALGAAALLHSTFLLGQNTFPSSGKVGIGTTSPSHTLQVTDNARMGIRLGGPSTSSGAVGDIIFYPKDQVSINGAKYWNWSFRTDTWSGYKGDFVLYSHNGSSYTAPIIFQADGDVVLGAGDNAPRKGNIGIGTISPNSKLHVNAASGQNGLRVELNGSTRLYLPSNGGLAVGNNTTPPARGLYVYDKINVNTTSSSATGKINLRTGWGDWAQFHSTSNTGYWAFHQGQNQTDFHIYYKHTDGSIIYPLKLKTDGSIETNELLVADLNATEIKSKQLTLDIDNVVDYVFEEDYNLRSLNEVEQFVKENKHLPGIPKGSDIESEGMNVAEMSNLLLEKVEELTLYMIELNKEIEKLKYENELLKASKN
jgi:hypothetical protein